MSTQLFCLHGFLGSSQDWELALPMESWASPVSSFDWMTDSRASSSKDWDELGDSIHDWAQAQTLPTSSSRVLVGYSMGGRLALHALLRNPELWDSAVIVSAHPGLTSEMEKASRLKHDLTWAMRFRQEPWNKLMREWDSQGVFGDETNPLPREESPGLRAKVALALEKWSLAAQSNLRPALMTLNKRVLWLAGENDGKYLQLARECAQLSPQFQFRSIPGAGHRAPWTANDEFQSILKTWIDKPSPARVAAAYK